MTTFWHDSGGMWGLSGPGFLVIEVAAVIVTVMFAIAITSRMKRSSRPDLEVQRVVRALDPVALAALRGPAAAVSTAIASLLVRGDLATAAGGVVVPAAQQYAQSPRDPYAQGPRNPVEDAVLAAAYVHGRLPTVSGLLTEPPVSARLVELETYLAEVGVLRTRARAVIEVLGGIPLLLVFCVGMVRLIDGMSKGRPVGFLIMLMLVTGLVLGGFVAAAPATLRNRCTAPAQKALEAMQLSNLNLCVAPSKKDARMQKRKPRRRDVPAGRLPLSVALFGTGALLGTFPAEAAALDIPVDHLAPPNVASGGSGGGSSSSCGGGGGCGGGCGG